MTNWHPGMPESETYRTLEEQARQRWGPERLPALQKPLEQMARWLSLVCQEGLEPLDEEPDFLFNHLSRDA